MKLHVCVKAQTWSILLLGEILKVMGRPVTSFQGLSAWVYIFGEGLNLVMF